MINYAIFACDWRGVPLGAVVSVIKKHPDWNLFVAIRDGERTELIVCKDAKTAMQAWKQQYAEFIEDQKEFLRMKDILPAIKKWKD